MSSIQSTRAGAAGTRHTRKRTQAAQALDSELRGSRTRAPAAETDSMATSEARGEALSPMTDIPPGQWRVMVAEAAYYRAQRRGFRGGSPEEDWFEAEEEIRRSLEER